MQAVLCVGHGSRVEEGCRQALDFMKKSTEALDVPIVEFCFLELAEPNMEEGIARCIQQGADSIAVLPLLLLSAGHAKRDIPAKLEQAKRRYPNVVFSYGRPFGVHGAIVDILMERMREKAELEEGASVLLVGRGSSDPAIKRDFGRIRRLLEDKHPFQSVQTAYLAAAKPAFEEGLDRVWREGHSRVFVVPYLLFTGVLMNEMKRSIEARNAHSHRLVLCEPLGYHPNLKTVVQQRVDEVTNITGAKR